MRKLFYTASFIGVAGILGLSFLWQPFLYAFLVFIPFIALGLMDTIQKRHTIRRNFPILGHGRYLMEMIRPEINQYFV
jgi:hypothetical protein